MIKPGDKVRHKRYEHYGKGNVKKLSKSGKRAYVAWPKKRKNGHIVSFGFSKYHAINSLVKE